MVKCINLSLPLSPTLLLLLLLGHLGPPMRHHNGTILAPKRGNLLGIVKQNSLFEKECLWSSAYFGNYGGPFDLNRFASSGIDYLFFDLIKEADGLGL